MLSTLLITAKCVEETKYRQCEQLGYCYRNREPEKQHWKLIVRSFEYNKEYFQCLIQDDTYDKQLNFYVYFLQAGLRFRVDPSEAENFQRFDCAKEKTVVNPIELNTTKRYSHTTNKTHIFLYSSDTQVILQVSPFLINVQTKRGRVVTINPDDTALFEHNRNRNRFPRLFDANDFDGTVDKVPNGPTAVAMDFFWHGSNTRIHGLPEHTLNLTIPYTTHRLKRRGQIEYQAITDPVRLFNVDIHRYEIGNPMAMYGSIPFAMARDGNRAAGLFWCNAAETWVDLSEERGGVLTRFLSEGGYIDFFLFLGPTPKDVLMQYTRLTGKPHLPQKFGLGFHMSRWGWKSTDICRDVTHNLDANIIPHDSLWWDLDHTDDKLYFTFHPHYFKDAEQFQDEIDPLERKVVAVIDPHVRVDYGYPLFEKALNNRYLIRTRIDSEYTAECWPGDSVWIDFSHPWARVWWETLFDFDEYLHSTLTLYAWNDMNEPAVFNVPDNTVPKDTVHYHKIENRELHNAYGHMMSSATWGGLMKRDYERDDRPFILSRSFFAGSQKYAFTWTGDNTADWQQMRNSLAMVMSLGLAGMPYSGADVGGFFDDPDNTLYVRWIQLGAWCYTFFRCHSHHETKPRELYGLKGMFLEAAKKAIQERYQMFPVWYTLSRHANLTGTPVVRPLWWEFPTDRRFADVEDRVMLGNSILVIPVFSKDDTERRVELPFARWFDFRTLAEKTCKEGTTVIDAPLSSIPVLIRGGSVVPMKMWKRRTTSLLFRDPLTLIVTMDDDQTATGDFYDDDGVGFQFACGHYIHRRFTYTSGVLSSRPFDNKMARGKFYDDYDIKIERIKVAGLEKRPVYVRSSEGEYLEIEWREEVLTIHRLNLSVRDNWAILFEFEGEAPPDAPPDYELNTPTDVNEEEETEDVVFDLPIRAEEPEELVTPEPSPTQTIQQTPTYNDEREL